jgi:protease-4
MIERNFVNRLRPASALLAWSFALTANPSSAGAPPELTDPGRRELLPSSPSVTGGAVGGLVNPAAWATSRPGELAFWWDDRTDEEDALDNWGILHGGVLGFSAERRTFREGGIRRRVRDVQAGLAFGDRESHFGLAWRWSSGDEDLAERESGLAIGTLTRPSELVSFGSTAFFSAESGQRTALFDIGIRPFGQPRLTVFGDYSLTSENRFDEGRWSAGAEVRPIAGIHLGGRVRDSEDSGVEFQAHLGVVLGGLGMHSLSRIDDDGDRLSSAFLLRANPPYRGLNAARMKLPGSKPLFETIDLEKKTLTYQRDLWFETDRVAWIDLLQRLERVREDERTQGVALNLAGARIRSSLLWELRREIEALQDAGKEVVIHADELRIGGVYLASVADRLSLDPHGHLELMGLAAHRTYMKGLLGKLGIGFEEHRYFEYKSANETFTRADMSEADREQLGRMIDLFYERFRGEISDARKLGDGEFDRIVEDIGVVTAKGALDLGLIDAIGRWPDVKTLLEERGFRLSQRNRPRSRVLPDERWGAPPKLALVYADGLCAMDSGIKARSAYAYLEKLAKRRDVAAVVLRADSPGGLPQPADLLAEGLDRNRAKGKPVVVSQGDVAASGGYWIGTKSDHVFTTPLTITGSIGVVSGWVWDEGVGEKTGFSADGVSRGSHADLLTGIRFPVLGVKLARRNLNDEERERVREVTIELYDTFVTRVAENRRLSENRVREIAEGRVWIGEDAVAKGLCDELGTLRDAIAEARKRAGLEDEDELDIEEFPPRRRFHLPKLLPSPFSLEALRLWTAQREEPRSEETADYPLEYLRAISEDPAEPLLLLPPELLPRGWAE